MTNILTVILRRLRGRRYANICERRIVTLREWRGETGGKTNDDSPAFFRFCLRHVDQAYSQLFQDLFVLYESGSKTGGYFVEFGAGDGVYLSNSYLLETRYGWSGIIAEPARGHHQAIRNSRHCSIDERCVWTKSDETLVFNEAESAELSTIDSFSNSDAHGLERSTGARYDVNTISLLDLLKFHGAPHHIDYLSIDTEGSELEILAAFNWDAYQFGVITVEHNGTAQRQKIFQLLTSKGYVRKFEAVSDFDDWYVKN